MTNKATAVVAALTYELNGEKQGFDLTPGDNLTLSWGLSQLLPLKKDMSLLLEIGPAGYLTPGRSPMIPAALRTRPATRFTPWAARSD